MAEPRTPTHYAFAVLEQPTRNQQDETKAKWIKLGAGWENQDGSISVLLDALPLAWSAGYRGMFKLVVQPARDDDQQGNRNRNQRNDRGGRR